ncbi:MAG: polyprenyl synthetase family protein [Solirubrobacterales bacterium]|nr:polyprenyl synthetase family protein [Solirubrobacterales bacterium]MCO5326870.1 polyprenyl synthetase family protein [Solirubrobacterales bacterium]
MSRSAAPEPVTEVIDRASGWLPARMTEVERRLESLVGNWGPRLSDDAGSTLAAGGKRMRPLLVLLCAGPDAGREAIRAATAIELVHMATLVHDDVLDSAPLRRGVPTVVARSGRDRAVATGDLLFSRAFAELAAVADDPTARRQVQLLAAASVALARGELAQRHDAFDTRITVERYAHRCKLKTAALFECACTIGAARPAAAEQALLAFGREIGLAFQILDDVLDVLGPPERTGKARGTDLLDGTVTLPFILAGESDPGLLELDLHSLTADEAEGVCDRIAATGAAERARDDARDRVERAKSTLAAAADVTPQELELLHLVADGVVERYS